MSKHTFVKHLKSKNYEKNDFGSFDMLRTNL